MIGLVSGMLSRWLNAGRTMSGSIRSSYESNANPIAAMTTITHCRGVSRAATVSEWAVAMRSRVPAAGLTSLRRRGPSCPPRQLGHRHDAVVGWIVDGNDPLHVELQPLNVIDEAHGVRARRTRRRRRGRLRVIAVGLEQHFLFGEIRDDHPVVVKESLQMMQLDDTRTVGQHSLLADRLDDRF